MKKGGNADGQENKRAEKSDIGTHSARFRNWNTHSRNQNGYREYPIRQRGGKPPHLKYNIVCLQNQYGKRNF